MIGETGKNLSVLITSEMGKDWETFETWYSFFKNLPDAQVTIACQRTSSVPFQMFQWGRRLKLDLFFHDPFSKDDPLANRLNAIRHAIKRKMPAQNILVVSPLTIAIDALDPKIAVRMAEKTTWINRDTWFLRNPDIERILNEYLLADKQLEDSEPLCVQANETETLTWLVNHQKGCGKWIDTLRGCPFSSAAGLASTTMTVNENRIIELWKRMCPLYSALM